MGRPHRMKVAYRLLMCWPLMAAGSSLSAPQHPSNQSLSLMSEGSRWLCQVCQPRRCRRT